MNALFEPTTTRANARSSEASSSLVVPRIRVLKFVSVLAIGGSERQALLLGQELDRSRFDLHLGCGMRTDDNIEAGLVAQGVRVTQYGIRNLYGMDAMRQRLRLAQYLRKERIDVMHAYNFYSNVFAIPAARLAGVPVIIASIRDNGASWTPAQRRIERWICRMAHQVVVNAEVIKRRLAAEGYDESRITMIHNGCPVSTLKAVSDTLRKELDLPAAAPVVGLVARLERVKGIEYFFEAAAQVKIQRPEARFLIVGDNRLNADYREELKMLARHLKIEDVVRFTGFRSNVTDYLSLFSVSVLSSLSEGLSNSLLEAMAAGIPVVATNVGGNPEVVEDGVTGILVPPRNPLELARAICRILNDKDLAAVMAQAGRRRIAERFSTRAMVSQSERLYSQLLADVRSPR